MEVRKKTKGRATNVTRSRSGCLSCKKLRIKCDQRKPKCEYCIDRNKECVYPINLVTVEFKQLTQRQTIAGHDVMSQFNLNNPTNQLGISKFELRLLDFFNNQCIQDMTNGVDDVMHTIWTTQIPPLVLESDLIRNSIYSYASLKLYPLCEDLNKLRIQDDLNSQIKFRHRIGAMALSKQDLALAPESDELFVKTTNYFINTLSGKNRLLNKLKQSTDDIRPDDQLHSKMILATELTVSSRLILLFLSIHSHRLLPLVSFDKSESDLISICQGMRQTMMLFHTYLQHSAFKAVFKIQRSSCKILPVKESQFPIIISLRQDLELEYANRDISSINNDDYDALYNALELLHSSISQCISYGHSVPLFRWISLLSNHVHQLLYSKNLFALRILYAYSALSILMKYQTFKDANIWLDFMSWYNHYNHELYHEWKYPMDKSLYFLVLHKDFKYIESNYTNLQDFDPEFWEQVISVGDVAGTCS